MVQGQRASFGHEHVQGGHFAGWHRSAGMVPCERLSHGCKNDDESFMEQAGRGICLVLGASSFRIWSTWARGFVDKALGSPLRCIGSIGRDSQFLRCSPRTRLMRGPICVDSAPLSTFPWGLALTSLSSRVFDKMCFPVFHRRPQVHGSISP